MANVKKRTFKPSTLNIDGKIIDDDKELATKFNNFLFMWGLIQKTIPKVPNISPSRFLKNRNQINFVNAHYLMRRSLT